MSTELFRKSTAALVVCLGLSVPASAQQVRPSGTATGAAPAAIAEHSSPGYVIGVGDVLAISFWRDPTMSGDVLVRPDGKISLPLLKDVPAAGYTPERLASVLRDVAAKYVADPDVAVVVKEIRSRRVFVVGAVATPGMITLTGDMNVLQVISMAGGLLEYADKKHVAISRTENGVEKRLKFNYQDVLKGKNMKQNILVQPGDTIVVR